MEREDAYNLLRENLKNENLIKHSLAMEAAMAELARHFVENEEDWALAGLLHDIDYEKTKEKPELHSKIGAEMLEDEGVKKEICQAVLTHNHFHGFPPESLMAKALYGVDPLTGLIVAATLVLPSKKINELAPENVLKRFKEPAFARGANREVIKNGEKLLDLPLAELVKITLRAMQRISNDLGL